MVKVIVENKRLSKVSRQPGRLVNNTSLPFFINSKHIFLNIMQILLYNAENTCKIFLSALFGW
jgi:hypothetical protein